MTETKKERIYRKAFEEIKRVCDTQDHVDSRLSKLAKNHENVTKYIEKVTGKNIDVVLAENAAPEAEEEE